MRTVVLWRWGSPPQEAWALTPPDPSAVPIDSVSDAWPVADNGLPASMPTSYNPSRSYRQLGNGDAVYAAQPGATNHFDMKIEASDVGADGRLELFRGHYYTDGNIQAGDHISFKVVDKDDVLGMFASLGLSVAAGDVLELSEYVRHEHLVPSQGPTLVVPGGSSLPIAGLYLRTTVTCVVLGIARNVYVGFGTAR